MITAKFERRTPSPQTAADIFAGKWAGDLGPCGITGTGQAPLLSDYKAKLAADTLGQHGRLDGMTILELGPLEAAHTYQMEKLGAKQIVAVESNTEAYLKCLVLKEILGLRNSRFLCGDVLAFLEDTSEKFDMIFCSGILYHMQDPIALISQASRHTSRCFVWTHYLLDEGPKPQHRTPRSVVSHGFETVYYEFPYPNAGDDHFWGGNAPVAAWMTRGEIIRAFRYFGFTSVEVLRDDLGKAAGPAFSLAAWR